MQKADRQFTTDTTRRPQRMTIRKLSIKSRLFFNASALYPNTLQKSKNEITAV